MIRVIVSLVDNNVIINKIGEGKAKPHYALRNKSSIVLCSLAFEDIKNKVGITCYLDSKKNSFMGYMPKLKFQNLELRR